MKLKIVNNSNNPLPQYATEGSAGLDIRAYLEQDIIIEVGQRCLISTGLFFEIEKGFEAQLRPRSGLALKFGITVLNAPGTIDSDYRGEIKALLINHSDTPYVVKNGDRIAQVVIQKCETVSIELSNELSSTDRGAGGYGHTGINESLSNNSK